MKDKVIYDFFNPDPFHTHMKLIKRIASSSVLEIGSSTGYFSHELLKTGCQVTGIELDTKAYQQAKIIKGARFYNRDVYDINKFLHHKYDIILLADVLEHLKDPLKILLLLKKFLKSDGKFLISVPNIANLTIRLQLFFFGRFNYQEYGILDKTHLRFFTKRSIENLLSKAGLNIIDFDVVAGFETSRLYSKTIGRVVFRIIPLRWLEYFLTKLFPELLALEFIYEAKSG